MSWSTILKIGSAVVSKGSAMVKGAGNATAKIVSKTPAMTKGVSDIGQTLAKPVLYVTRNPKTAIVAPGVAYAGWKALVDRQPILESATTYGKKVLDVAVGEENSNAFTDSLGKAKETITDVKDTVTEGKGLLSSLNESLGGIKSFISNITGGEGLNMFGNFFKNIFSGNVSGMSFVGLLAAGLLTFGRFGWLGKIAGALLGMTMIGNNSVVQQPQPQSQAVAHVAQSESRGLHR